MAASFLDTYETAEYALSLMGFELEDLSTERRGGQVKVYGMVARTQQYVVATLESVSPTVARITVGQRTMLFDVPQH